jgi:nucleotide-binding universal stress UspA family protein
MGLFKTVLCPIDLGPNTGLTLDAARHLAEDSKAKLIVLHIVPLPLEAVGQPMLVEPLSSAQDEARARMEQLAKGLGLKVPYEVAAVIGDPSHEIIRAINEHDADVVVMATHGRTGLSRFFLGSVAERVVRESPVPVLTVPAHHARKKSLTSVLI